MIPKWPLSEVDDPFATGGTYVLGINDSGQVAGYYTDDIGVHGFVETAGNYTTINDPLPGNENTYVLGINDAGQIVGDDTYGAFLATPTAVPEPGTLALLCSGVLSLGLIHRRKRT